MQNLVISQFVIFCLYCTRPKLEQPNSYRCVEISALRQTSKHQENLSSLLFRQVEGVEATLITNI